MDILEVWVEFLVAVMEIEELYVKCIWWSIARCEWDVREQGDDIPEARKMRTRYPT